MSEKEKLLEIQDLVKDYGNGPVLDKVSLDVYKGDVIVLIGPSGCGKSTLLRCINGLEEIQSGKILLDGKEITGKKANWREVRQKIGRSFTDAGNNSLFKQRNETKKGRESTKKK